MAGKKAGSGVWDSGSASQLPLAGVTVVAIEQAVAAPLATRHLADWGARVIKIERPGVGDFARHYDGRVKGLSSYFVWLNRSKESLTLDLKRPEAVAVVERLLDDADVLVHNLAPGAMDRLGFSSTELQKRFPRLIICGISGYGTDGPYRDRKAYDLLVQSEAGLLSITGTPDTPSKAGISVADTAAGMYAYTGILTALIRRANTGRGSALEVSMLEALGEWMSHAYYATSYGGHPLPRTGARHASIAPYGPFPAANGETVYLGIQNEREWQRFCASVLQQPDLAQDSRFANNTARVQNREALDRTIGGVFDRMTAKQIVARLEEADIAYARLNTMEEFAAHPQLAARNRWKEIGSPAGTLQALLPAVAMDGVTPEMGPIPAVGEHTDEILEALGYDRDTITRWRHDGMV